MTENKSPAWKGKTRGGRGGYLFFIGLIRFTGVRVAYVFLALVVIYFIPFAPKATAAIWKYGRRILKYNRWNTFRLLFRNYYVLGQTLIDKIAIGNGRIARYRFEFEGREPLLRLLETTGGVVMIGGHVGNWEVGAPFFEDYGKKMNIVMYDAEYRKIKELLERNGIGKNYKVIPVNRDNLTHVFEIGAALGRGEYVCFQGDRFVSDDHTLSVEFMGEKARFPLGPFQIAARMGKAVVFYFAMREKGNGYRFHFYIAAQGDHLKPREREKYILGQYVRTLEVLLKRYPEQWFNYYDFWQATAD